MFLRIFLLAIAMILGFSAVLIGGMLLFVDSPGVDPDPGLSVLVLFGGLAVGGGSLWGILRENRRWADGFRESFVDDPESNLAEWTVPAETWRNFVERETKKAREDRPWEAGGFGAVIGLVAVLCTWAAWGPGKALLFGAALALAGAGLYAALHLVFGGRHLRHEAKWSGPEIILRRDGLRIGAQAIGWEYFGAELESIELLDRGAGEDNGEGKSDDTVLQVVVLVHARNTTRHTRRVPVPAADRPAVERAIAQLASVAENQK